MTDADPTRGNEDGTAPADAEEELATGPEPAGDEQAEIGLLLAHPENRRRLAAWLEQDSPYTPVVVSEPEAGAVGDLCIVDTGALERHSEWIRRCKTSQEPRFYPVLLAHGSERSPTGESVWELIDETIRTPVQLPELSNRLRNLLERRQLSTDLAADLERTERRYQTVFQAVNDAILVVDPAGDRIVDANPRAATLFGHDQDELPGRSLCDELFGPDAAKCRELLDRVQGGEAVRRERLQCTTEDGGLLEAEVSASEIATRESPRLVLSVRDVTERHEKNRQLERQRSLLAELHRISQTLHECAQAVVQATSRGDLEQNVCDRLSDSDVYKFAWIGEWTDETIRPRSVGENTWEYLDQVEFTAEREGTLDGPTGLAFKTQNVQAVQDIRETRLLDPWREVLERYGVRATAAVPIQDEGRLFGVLNLYTTRRNAFGPEEQSVLEDLGRTIGREITGIHAREEAERLQEAVEHAGSAVSIVDKDGRIQYVNPAFEALTGYSRSDIVGASMSVLSPDAQDSEFPEGVLETALDGETWEGELRIRTRTGQRRYVEQTVAPIVDREEGIEQLVTVSTDQTEQRRQRQQLQVLHRVLRHNFRNQLNVIEGYAEIIRDSTDDQQEAEAVDTISKTVDDLLAISSRSRQIEQTFTRNGAAPETEPVTRIVRSAVEGILEGASGVETSVSIPDVDGEVNPELETAIEELISNAIAHTEVEPPVVEVTLDVFEEGSFPEARITVADNGTRIPENEQRVLREGEETPLLHGSGLGLWLVNWIVIELGGRIDIAENEPRGSIVELTVPLTTGR